MLYGDTFSFAFDSFLSTGFALKHLVRDRDCCKQQVTKDHPFTFVPVSTEKEHRGPLLGL